MNTYIPKLLITTQSMSRSVVVRVTILAALSIGLLSSAFSIVSKAKEGNRPVLITDDCDPVSFNAQFGPGTCLGNGKTTFDKFIAQLTQHQDAFLWMFAPRESTVPVGKTLGLGNTGGETHTFTKVAQFGGGFVIPLNQLSGNPVPTPECTTGAVLVPGLFLQPRPDGPSNIFIEAGEEEEGPTAGGAILPVGQTVKFQCCIHPWMRTEVRVNNGPSR
jgi:hypothetical protein